MSPRKQITYSQHPNHAARSAHAKGEKAFRTYDTSYIRPKRSPLPAIIGIAVLVVGTCVLAPPSPQPVVASLLAAAVLASVVLSE